MTWSAEFNGPDGSPPNPVKWTPEGGGNGWGNNELQTYTSRPQNIHLEGGNLVIQARKEEFTGSDGIRRHFTSGRLSSQGLFSRKYGRFEGRIRIPAGREWGSRPMFSMMSISPQAGQPTLSIRGSLHGPGYYGSTPLTTAYTLPQIRFSDAFHIFAVEWEPQVIRFYVDGELYASKTPRDLPAGTHWVFDHPFFVVLNLAVGGNFPGKPDKSTVFPQRMLVDYVRVYARK